MSVCDQIFVRTGRTPAEVARLLADHLGGHARERFGSTWLFLDPATLLGASPHYPDGELGGPVVAHPSGLRFRPASEGEVLDFFNVELRLWLSGTRRGEFEARLADRLFDVVALLGFAAVHVRNDDVLVGAARPGAGTRGFPIGTTIYDSDRELWREFVPM